MLVMVSKKEKSKMDSNRSPILNEQNKFCLFVPSLTSCLEKATVALYFGRIRTRFGVVHFRVFQLFL